MVNLLPILQDYIPLFGVIYLAGLQAIPKDYYEAAMIDGAGPFQRFIHITIPLLLPTILFVMVISLLSAVKVFLNPLVMTGGGPNGTTRVLPYFIYETGFTYFRQISAVLTTITVSFAVLLITVRSLAPRSRRAAMRFSGMPQRPKPAIMMDAPSGMSRSGGSVGEPGRSMAAA